MEIKGYYDFNDLLDEVWSGAIETMQKVQEAQKEDELMELLEEEFNNGIPTITEVNDFLWFEDDFIFEQLEIEEEEEEEEL